MLCGGLSIGLESSSKNKARSGETSCGLCQTLQQRLASLKDFTFRTNHCGIVSLYVRIFLSSTLQDEYCILLLVSQHIRGGTLFRLSSTLPSGGTLFRDLLQITYFKVFPFHF
jgi:hypothetical protein